MSETDTRPVSGTRPRLPAHAPSGRCLPPPRPVASEHGRRRGRRLSHSASAPRECRRTARSSASSRLRLVICRNHGARLEQGQCAPAHRKRRAAGSRRPTNSSAIVPTPVASAMTPTNAGTIDKPRLTPRSESRRHSAWAAPAAAASSPRASERWDRRCAAGQRNPGEHQHRHAAEPQQQRAAQHRGGRELQQPMRRQKTASQGSHEASGGESSPERADQDAGGTMRTDRDRGSGACRSTPRFDASTPA